MPDLEKVIAEIHYCTKGYADPGEDECNPSKCRYAVYQNSYDYDCKELLFKDALALLRRWEPRVMALDEIKKDGSSFVWAEIYSPHVQKMALIYCTVKQFEGWRESYLLAEESGVKWGRDAEDYNRDIFQGIHSGWRCWTARPTEEQRKAVKWDA